MAPSEATRDLWRFVDSGEIDKFEAVLPRADINTRNEHGMTALMRAARHGRKRMVRALLEHGADPNLVRNDNFTALSLAAFFGHTEIVEMLLGQGARADVSTRFGTSPRMWATARSFGDVAKRLEQPGDQKMQAVPVQSVLSVESIPSQPVEVRTLKDPPEIWDLVHEAPRNFNARSAFLARISTSKMGFVLRAAVVLVVIGVGVVAALYWKGGRQLSKGNIPPPQAVVSLPVTPVQAAAPEAPVAEPMAPSVAIDTSTETSTDTSTPVPVSRRSRSVARSRAIETNVPSVNTIETAPAPAPPPAAVTTVANSNPNPENVTKPKPAAPLSPQMIAPPKTTQPKAKVIQWP